MTKKRKNATYVAQSYFYPVTELEERTDIVWIDNLANQTGFLKHEYCGSRMGSKTRFHYFGEDPIHPISSCSKPFEYLAQDCFEIP